MAGLGSYKEAIECFDKAIEIDPDDVEIWCDKGDLLKKLEKYQEALKCYNRALKIDPDFEPALKAKEEILDSES